MTNKNKHNDLNITGPESIADKANDVLDAATTKAGEALDAAGTKVNEVLNADNEASSQHDKTDSSRKNSSKVVPTVGSHTTKHADNKQDDASDDQHESDCDCNLIIDEGVVEKIAFLAANKISGIVDMKGNVFSMIQEGLGGNDRTKGTEADIEDGDTTIELSVILKYGTSAVDVFNEIRKIVSKDIRAMTGLEVSSLTVNIVDVMDDDEIRERYDDDKPASAEKRHAA